MKFQRLRDLREDKDLYQADIAIMLGIKKSAYSQMEREKINPSMDKLCILADFYNVCLDYLMGRTDDKTPFPHNKHYAAFLKTKSFPVSRLRELRKEKNMTQAELANIIGLTQHGYSQIETGRKRISSDFVIKLCELYNVNAEYLLNLTEQRQPRSANRKHL